MVEKIPVRPESVRGLGNIISPAKKLEDFSVFNSNLSYVDGFYTMGYSTSVRVELTASASSIRVGESLTLTATVSDGGTVVEGASVSFTSGNLAIGTAVTGSDGVATLTVSTLEAGSYSITATYDKVVSSAVTVTVSYGFTSVTVSSDKSILSYADSESAVLTAQLMNGDVSASVSGETVDFYKYVDGTNDVLLGSDVTDSNGEASYSYASTGVGDVGLYAKVRSLVSETYTIEDYIDYQPMTSNAHQSRWTIPSAVTSASIFGYSSAGWKFGNASSFSSISAVESQDLPYSMEFTVTDRYASINSQPIFGAYFGSNYLMVNCDLNSVVINVNGSRTTYSHSYTLPFTVRFELTSTTVSVYIDDVLIGSKTHSLTGNPVPTFQTGTNRWNVIKDYKIKPL